IEKTKCGAPPLAGLREIATRKENHIRERRMMADDLRVLGCDQPVDARTRITRTQFHEHRDRMNDIAERRWFDQQDARELGILKPRVVRLVYGYCFGLAIQFAKLSQGDALF